MVTIRQKWLQSPSTLPQFNSMDRKQELAKIMEENLDVEPAERLPKSIKLDIRLIAEAPEAKSNDKISSVIICNEDTAMTAYRLHDQGLNPLILNFASDKRPGGGCYNGAQAQEECLFYRSLYHLTLTENLYPLKPYDAVYSPSVPFFRDADFRKIDKVRKLACLAVAAVRHPDLTEDKTMYLLPHDKELMRLKIESVFHVAAKYKHNALVLGAFGCGAFGNPPEQVARMFQDAIAKYGHSFSHLVFAILDTSDDKHTIEPFQRVLGTLEKK